MECGIYQTVRGGGGEKQVSKSCIIAETPPSGANWCSLLLDKIRF